MLKVYITNLGKYNEGTLIGEWLEFPYSEKEFEELLDRIGINEEYEEYIITDYEEDLGIKFDEYDNLEELNELIRNIESLNNEELDIFKALVEWGYYDNYSEAVENVDSFILYKDINSESELGDYWLFESGCYEVPKNFAYYIDTQAWGRDYSLEAEGTFTDYGWIELA